MTLVACSTAHALFSGNSRRFDCDRSRLLVNPRPAAVLQRAELVQRIRYHRGRVIVVAGSGSGKSQLASQITGSFPARQVIDDATTADLAALTTDGVVLSRTRIDHLDSDRSALRLGADDLWFSVDEIGQLLDGQTGDSLADPAVAAALHAQTGGWPLAVAAVVQLLGLQPAARRQIDRIATQGPHFRPVFEHVLRGVPTDFVDKLSELANLPIILPEFLNEEDGGDGWSLLGQYGVPLRTNIQGFHVLPAAIRLHLAARRPLSEERAVTCGRALVQHMGLATAIGMLMDAQAPHSAEVIVADTPETGRYGPGQLDLLHRLEQLVYQVGEPRCETLLTIAALNLRLARFSQLKANVEHCVDRATVDDEPLVALRARIIGQLALARSSSAAISDQDLQELVDEQQRIGDRRSELEINELSFVTMAGRSDTASLVAAIALGNETADRLAASGDTYGAAELLRQVAVGPVLDLGRYNELLELERRAGEMAGETMPSERSLVFRALATALVGNLPDHEQAVATVTAVYEPLSTSWLEAYLWGARMVAVSIAGDADGVIYAYSRYRQSIGQLATTPSGTIWECFAAAALALVGQAEAAETALARARTIGSHNHPALGMAELVVLARVGDPATAFELYAELTDAGLLPLERRWRADLELVFAARRMGIEAAPLESIFHSAARVGMAGLARILARPLDDSADLIVIHLFGEFAVTALTRPIAFSLGKPTDLIKMLALHEGPVHIEKLIDALWPDGDLESGRLRVKNVINRARQVLGKDAIIRRGELVMFSSRMTTDLSRFWQSVAVANAAPKCSREFVASAAQSLDASRLGLLPSELFAEWCIEERWKVDATIARLLDGLSRCPPAEIDLDWLIGQAIEARLTDRSFFGRIADGARDCGQLGPADRAAREAHRLTELVA